MDKLHEILRRIAELRHILATLRERREILRDRCARLTTFYGEKVQIRNGGENSNALAELGDLEQEIDHWNKELAAAEHHVEILLNRLADSPKYKNRRDAEILRLRDVREMPWKQVRSILASMGFRADTERTLYNWHRAALRRLKQKEEKTT